jgi:flagellar hook protein FlgE
MAINGDGWFVVAKPIGTSDNQPVFSGVANYTRAGDFQLNSGGYLVNGAGYYLMGIPIDPTTGNPTGSSPQVLQFTNNFVPAQTTTAITYQLNLPSTPKSGMLKGSDFQANPLAGASPAATITGTGAKLTADAVASGTGSTAPRRPQPWPHSGSTAATRSLSMTVSIHIHVDRHRHCGQSDGCD